ncbi:MAG: FkbM family methyltransferase [Gemmatimonadota bacterium]
MSHEPDLELRRIASLSRRLPRVRAARFVARRLRKFYLRRPREDVVAEVAGQRMRLSPSDYVEGQLLFAPQFYEFDEREYVRAQLRAGDVFVDLGAHVGLYTLLAAHAVGPNGRVVSVEADVRTHERLVENVRLNDYANVTTFQCGVSDRTEVRKLSINASSNRGASSFLVKMGEEVEVECLPLSAILEKAGVSRIHGMKLDIEGFEFRVLNRFLEEAPESLLPGFVVVEQKDWWVDQAGGNALELLQQYGYRVAVQARDRKKWPNYVLVRE